MSTAPQFVSVNAINFSDRARTDAAISLTRYVDIAGQAHDLKAGLEFEVTSSTDRQGTPGGMRFFQQPRFRVAQIWDGGVDEATSRRGTVYVRDQWSIGDRSPYRNLSSGLDTPCGIGLLGALTWFGLDNSGGGEDDRGELTH